MDIRTTRCANNYGPHQNVEKVIPNFINKILRGKKIGIYGDGENRREWIHVDDHCRAIALVARKGKSGETYNVPASIEISNRELAFFILEHLNVSREQIEYIEDRKGHDFRYSLSGKKFSDELNFKSSIDFHAGLQSTIDWYVEGNKTKY